MAGITAKTISQLFGMAAGRCSMCEKLVVEADVKIGEMAHIIAKKNGGPRGSISFDGDVNGYKNLILLCPNHHSEIDSNPTLYPPEKLLRIKAQHERRVRYLFEHKSKRREMDVSGLQALMRYLPFTQLVALTSGLPERFDNRLYQVTTTLENFAIDNPQCRPFGDINLERHYSKFWKCMDKLVEHEQDAVNAQKNVYVPGYSLDLNSSSSYLNPKLNHEQRRTNSLEIRKLLTSLSNSYYPFLEYLKKNYPEVDLASFVGR